MNSARLLAMLCLLVALGRAAPARAEKPCVVAAKSASVEAVTIRATGEAPFSLKVEGLPIEARPGPSGAELHFSEPLRFDTSQSWTTLSVETNRALVLKGGRLRLPAQLSVSSSYLDTQTTNDDAIGIDPLLDIAVRAPLRVPCSALTLGRSPHDGPQPERWRVAPAKATKAAWAKGEFPLYRQRKAVDPWHIAFAGPLEVIREKGDWVKVRARWAHGAHLEGWAKASALQITSDPWLLEGTVAGLVGRGHCGRLHRQVPSEFLLARETPVHASPGGAIWAHTAKALRVKAFPIARSDGWVQVVEIHGFPSKGCSDHNRFWVHAKSIQWTAGPTKRPRARER